MTLLMNMTAGLKAFLTSSSVTSSCVQFSSVEIMGQIPYMVVQLCVLISSSLMRWEGSLQSILSSKSLASTVRSGLYWISSFRILSYRLTIFTSSNGHRPWSRQYNVAPNAQISTLLPLNALVSAKVIRNTRIVTTRQTFTNLGRTKERRRILVINQRIFFVFKHVRYSKVRYLHAVMSRQ